MTTKLKIRRIHRVALVDQGSNARASLTFYKRKVAGVAKAPSPLSPAALAAHLQDSHGVKPPAEDQLDEVHQNVHTQGQFVGASHQHPEMVSATAKVGRKISAARLAVLRSALSALDEVIAEAEAERGGEEPPSSADLGKRADAAIRTAEEALALLGKPTGDPSATMREIESLAKSRRDADPSKTVEQAMADTLLTPEGSQLYAEYVVAQREQADALAKSRTPDAPAPPATNVEKSNVQKMAHLIDAEVEKLAKAAPSMSRSDLLAAFYSTPEGKEAYTLYDRARRQAAR